MPIQDYDYDQLPTGTDMERTLLPDPEMMYGFRNMFRVDSEAPNRDGDSVKYPSLDEDFEGEMAEIETGDPHPLAKLSYSGAEAAWTEYGFKFTIHDNDIQDSKINIVVINQREQTKARMHFVDGLAGNVLEANHGGEIGDDTTDINYAAFADAEAELIDAGWDANRFVIGMSPKAWAKFAKTDEFTSNTERFAGELRSDGIQLGELMGYPVMRLNTGPLKGADNAAYMVDRGVLGWESPRRQFTVDKGDYDRDERETPYYTDGRIDFLVTNPSASRKVVGGST